MEFILQVFPGAIQRLGSLDREVFRIFFFSLKIGLIGTFLGLAISLPLAWRIFILPPRWKAAALLVFQGLLSVPTVIVGTLVYLFISRRGPLGALEMMYSPTGVVIGEILLIVPLVTVFLHSILSQIPTGWIETAENLGIRGWHFFRLLWRECRVGIGVAACVGFGRILSEVGVAMILGGNIKGSTRTLTTAIALETGKGDTELALALGILLIFMALANSILVHLLQHLSHHRSPAEAPAGPSRSDLAPPRGDERLKNDSPELDPIFLNGVQVAFDGTFLFRDLSVRIPLTGGTSIMGVSGSGKTTLLRILAGLRRPDAGTIDSQGREMILVFQRPYLFSGSVAENILSGLRARGSTRTTAVQVATRAGDLSGSCSLSRSAGKGGGEGSLDLPPLEWGEALARRLGIFHLWNRNVSGLSGGEASRVSLARGLAVKPAVLLVDETLGHLDQASLALSREVLVGFVKKGGGLILVTHDHQVARSTCRNIYRLEGGSLASLDPAS